MTSLLDWPTGKLITLITQLAENGFSPEMAEGLSLDPKWMTLLARVYAEVIAHPPLYAHVVYEQPDMDELRRRFKDSILDGFAGVEFVPIERCKYVSRQNRELAFRYVTGPSNKQVFDIETMLFRMEERHIRPALYEELLSFIAKYPEEQRKFPIIALGSTAISRGKPCHVMASRQKGHYPGDFISIDYSTGWLTHMRFLGVEKNWKSL